MGVLSETNFHLLEDAQTNGYVLGLKELTGGDGLRRDIDDLLVHEPEAFNIFVLALLNLQEDSPKRTADKMGYFQVAGIHGLPLTLWNSEGVKLNKMDQYGSGYCHHGHLGFGPWHRPYLAMMEANFPELKYFDAVRRWRLPFWDYYRPRGGPVSFPGVKKNEITHYDYDGGIPDIFTIPSLKIRPTMKDDLSLFPNPFASFSFPKQGGGLTKSDWDTVPSLSTIRTERYPMVPRKKNKEVGEPLTLREAFNDLIARNKKDPVMLEDPLNIAINRTREEKIRMISAMLTDPSYGRFSAYGTNAQVTGGPSGSLEGSIHGEYHNKLGGDSGHMSAVPVAAFDPVFWIHHCQIDRLFAIWEQAHPKSWFATDKKQIKALQDANIWFDPDKPLEPFRTYKKGNTGTRGKDGWWTCNTSQDTKTYGYSYPDISLSEDSLVDFNKNYSWSYRKDKAGPFGKCPENMLPWNTQLAQVYQFTEEDLQQAPRPFISAMMASNPVPAITPVQAVPEALNVAQVPFMTSERTFTSLPSDHPTKAGSAVDESQVSRSWYIDLLVGRLALNDSFSFRFFLGPFEDNPLHYYAQPTLAGSATVFAAPVEACDNCGRQEEQAVLVTDTSDITPMLLDYQAVGELQSLSAEHVVQFLKDRLKWRVVKATGAKVDPRSIGSLKLGISSRLAPIPPATGEIQYQEFPEVIEYIITGSS
ncbi:Di-copper centre-containing protein [Glonium stellatum]|uniref:tyrosinase n=1 Tax=Glonium stellatum TaxID=574774 RepID=A0A8E2F2M6_9PEZI|nr:Di-copper centre-containing protein [Glonium stellatum]